MFLTFFYAVRKPGPGLHSNYEHKIYTKGNNIVL